MPKVVSLDCVMGLSLYVVPICWIMFDDSFNMTIFWYGTNPHISIPEVVSTCCVIGLSLYVVNVYRSVVGQPRRRLWWILIQNNDSKPRRSCYHIQMVLYQHKTTSSFESWCLTTEVGQKSTGISMLSKITILGIVPQLFSSIAQISDFRL